MTIVRFYNTYDIAVPIMHVLIPTLDDNAKVIGRFVISSDAYREVDIASEKPYVVLKKRPPFAVGKALTHLSYLFSAVLDIVREKADVNVFFTQPPFCLPILCFASRISRKRYVVHVMDYHPDFLVAEKKTPIKNLFCMLSNIAYSRALKRATQVVAIGECMQDKLIEKGLSADDITIIRNVSWSEADPEVDVNVIQDTIELGGEKIDISDRTVVLYSGNQGVAHEFRTILEAAVKLVHTHLFIFVGKGKRHADIVSAAQKLSNVYVMGYLDEQEFNRVKAFAHVHFISLREKYSGLMVPSKLYSSLHAGKVVLYEGSATSELAICLQNNKCGYTVPHGDIDAMTSALLRVHTEKDGVEFKEMGVRARNLYQAEYSYHRFGARYAQLLIPLL